MESGRAQSREGPSCELDWYHTNLYMLSPASQPAQWRWLNGVMSVIAPPIWMCGWSCRLKPC